MISGWWMTELLYVPSQETYQIFQRNFGIACSEYVQWTDMPHRNSSGRQPRSQPRERTLFCYEDSMWVDKHLDNKIVTFLWLQIFQSRLQLIQILLYNFYVKGVPKNWRFCMCLIWIMIRYENRQHSKFLWSLVLKPSNRPNV